MRIHQTITHERVMQAVEEQMMGTDNPGFCLACGEDAFNCEPDARGYECEYCGAMKVYGAEEVMLML